MGVKMIKTSVPEEAIRRFASGLCDSCLRKVMARATYYKVARNGWLIILAAQAGLVFRMLDFAVHGGEYGGFITSLCVYVVWLIYYRRKLKPPYLIAKRDGKFFKEEFDRRRGKIHV